MKLQHLPTQIAALALVALCGCGTVTTRMKGAGGLYSGFSADMEKVGSAEEWLNAPMDGRVGNWPLPCPRGLFWVVDIPFSLTADTLLLPVDALRPAAAKPDERNGEASPVK
ncbi:MAG TPA: YceK/YidQ family lipoprotein [Candidatus Sulfotelmatobacter sp.]|nr:YceK/YidQ family lipoprotein [Candidatus Sulfotelmatobacter sp.]